MTNDATQSKTEAAIDEVAAKAQPDVTQYNFVKPPQISKEQRIAVETVFSRFVLSLQDLLSALLRTPLDVSVQSVEHTTFPQFKESLSSPCATFVFDTGHGVGGEGVIDLSTPVAYYIVDRLFGGLGEEALQDRSLSELEQSVVRGVTERVLALLREAWDEHLTLTPEIVRYESTPENLRADSRVQTVLVARVEIRGAGGLAGVVALSLPIVILESFLQDLTPDRTARTRSSGDGHNTYRALIEKDLKFAHVCLTARLSPLSLSARSLTDLAPGQIIQTSQYIDLPIELHVNGRCLYLGTLGQVRRQVGLQITETVSLTPGDSAVRTTRGRVL